MIKHLIFVSVAFVSAASCTDQTTGTAEANKSLAQATIDPPPSESGQGKYPALQKAQGADKMPNDAFTETRIPCSDERKIAEALWAISSQQLNKAGNPQMVDYGVDKISLKDGPGQIAAVEYTFEPGDPGVISRAVDFYLITENCRVQYWEHTGP